MKDNLDSSAFASFSHSHSWSEIGITGEQNYIPKFTSSTTIGSSVIYEKDGNKLWRMFEEEDGLYLESLKTGKTYRFILEEVVK